MNTVHVNAELWTKLYKRFGKTYVSGRIWYEWYYVQNQIAFKYF